MERNKAGYDKQHDGDVSQEVPSATFDAARNPLPTPIAILST
jgi:hypothetical protein